MKSYWRRGGNEEGGDGEGRWGCNMGGGVVRKWVSGEAEDYRQVLLRFLCDPC